MTESDEKRKGINNNNDDQITALQKLCENILQINSEITMQLQ